MGAVRRMDDDESAIYGTVGYQAPEVAEVGPSVASDLYTVARTLAVLTFDFQGYTTVFADSLPDPDTIDVFRQYESFYRFLVRATDPDPDRRFASAQEMGEQLTGVLREVVSLQTGRARPALSTQFGPELRVTDTELFPALDGDVSRLGGRAPGRGRRPGGQPPRPPPPEPPAAAPRLVRPLRTAAAGPGRPAPNCGSPTPSCSPRSTGTCPAWAAAHPAGADVRAGSPPPRPPPSCPPPRPLSSGPSTPPPPDWPCRSRWSTPATPTPGSSPGCRPPRPVTCCTRWPPRPRRPPRPGCARSGPGWRPARPRPRSGPCGRWRNGTRTTGGWSGTAGWRRWRPATTRARPSRSTRSTTPFRVKSRPSWRSGCAPRCWGSSTTPPSTTAWCGRPIRAMSAPRSAWPGSGSPPVTGAARSARW